MVFNAKKNNTTDFFILGLSKKQAMKGELCAMNLNTE